METTTCEFISHLHMLTKLWKFSQNLANCTLSCVKAEMSLVEGREIYLNQPTNFVNTTKSLNQNKII